VSDEPAARLSEERTTWEWLAAGDAAERVVWPSQRNAIYDIAMAVSGCPNVSAELVELTASPNP
jgi:hypothetical protein